MILYTLATHERKTTKSTHTHMSQRVKDLYQVIHYLFERIHAFDDLSSTNASDSFPLLLPHSIKVTGKIYKGSMKHTVFLRSTIKSLTKKKTKTSTRTRNTFFINNRSPIKKKQQQSAYAKCRRLTGHIESICTRGEKGVLEGSLKFKAGLIHPRKDVDDEPVEMCS